MRFGGTRISAGDVGTAVLVYGDGAAVEVEFVGYDGHTVALITLEAHQIRPLDAHDIPHAPGIVRCLNSDGKFNKGGLFFVLHPRWRGSLELWRRHCRVLAFLAAALQDAIGGFSDHFLEQQP
jgi:Domain of unknown function (DUF4926)